jgi:hypothetical protein
MTFGDLINHITARAGDDTSEFRANVLRWLNLVRSDIADSHTWRCAFVADGSLTTSAATTDGLYALNSTYEQVAGNRLYDETNNNIIFHESYALQNGVDVDKTTTGFPDWWSDAGLNAAGSRKIYLWPIPDGAYTIRIPHFKRLTDISDETVDVDPYFGLILPWARCMEAGLDYYWAEDDNESQTAIRDAYILFQAKIKQRKRQDTASPHGSLRLKNVRSSADKVTARFNPAHFDNRG